jgi:hypothetical protein
LEKLLVPNESKCSVLLKKLSKPDNNIFDFLNMKKNKLEYLNKKALQKTEPLENLFVVITNIVTKLTLKVNQKL